MQEGGGVPLLPKSAAAENVTLPLVTQGPVCDADGDRVIVSSQEEWNQAPLPRFFYPSPRPSKYIPPIMFFFNCGPTEHHNGGEAIVSLFPHISFCVVVSPALLSQAGQRMCFFLFWSPGELESRQQQPCSQQAAIF